MACVPGDLAFSEAYGSCEAENLVSWTMNSV